MPIDIIIALTWVINKRNSGVFERYKRQPYLRVTNSFDEKGTFGIIGNFGIFEDRLWREAYFKLLRYQLGCPARREFGMDRDPALYLQTFMRRAEILVQPTPMTEFQSLSFLLELVVMG